MKKETMPCFSKTALTQHNCWGLFDGSRVGKAAEE